MTLEVEFQKHAPFLRALARRLASDQFAAEDLVQETYVAASGGKPRAENGLVPWLAGILRKRAARRVRTDSRRRRREQGGVANELAEDTASVASKLEVGRRLLQQVEELGADYRDVVFLRYYDDLSPKQISAKLGLPIGTVKTRLARALAQLRERLDAGDADSKRNWLPGLCALGGVEPMTGSATATMAPLMRRAVTLRVAVVAVVFLAAVVTVVPMWFGGVDPVLPAMSAGTPAAAEVAVETDNVVDRKEQQPVTAAVTVRGMLEDATFGAASGTGRPAPNVAVRCELRVPAAGRGEPRSEQPVQIERLSRLRSEELEGITDAAGRFEFVVPEGASLYAIKAAGSDLHRKSYWSAPRDWREKTDGLIMSRYPHGVLEGQVVEPSGAPVGGAKVMIGFRVENKRRSLETSADENGRFVFAKVPDNSWLEAEMDGFVRIAATRLVPAELGGWNPVTILMAPTATMAVKVTDSAGRLVTGLRGVAVGLGLGETGLLASYDDFGRPYMHNEKAPAGTAVLTVPAELELRMFVGETFYEQEREGRLIARGSKRSGQPIKLARGERRELGIVMAMDCVLHGSLVDASGEPVTDAYVTADRLQDGHYSSIGVIEVDAKGRFEHRFRADEPFDIIISATTTVSGKRISTDRYVTFDGREEVSEKIVLSSDNVIIGHATDAAGNAIDASIRCEVRVPKATTFAHRGTWGTADDGEFRVPTESGIDYRVVVSAPGFRTVTREVATSADATFVLEPLPLTQVRLRPLLPVGDTAELAWPVARGRIGFVKIRVGYFESRDGSAPQWPALRTDHAWTRASAASGRAGYREQAATGTWRYETHDGAVKDGRIELSLKRGPATIVISGTAADGAVLSRTTTGPITIGAEELDLAVPFAATGSRTGKVAFLDATPTFDAYVAVADDVGNLLSISASRRDPRWEQMLPTSSHGRFAIAGVPAGVWELRVGTRQELERGDARWRRRMVFGQNNTEPLEIKL